MHSWYSIFYWLTRADSVKTFFDTTSDIFTTLAVISFIAMVIGIVGKSVMVSSNNDKTPEQENVDPDIRAWELFRKLGTRVFWPTLILCLITWLGYMATPTKKDCLLIIAGGAVGNFITTDTSARQLPADVAQFLHVELRNKVSELSEDTRKEIGLQTPKEKFLDKAEKMTKEQLIEYLKSDSTATSTK